MDPNQYTPAPKQNPYDFIMQPQAPAPGQKSTNTQGGTGKRILVVAVGLAIFLILGVVVMSLLSSGKKNITDQLYGIAARQAEIIRVAESGKDKVRSSELQVLTSTTTAVITSDQKKTLALIDAKLVASDKTAAAKLKQYLSTQTDATLESAERTNNYDEAYTQVMEELYTKYLTELKQTAASLNDKKYEAPLSGFYTNSATLSTQIQKL